MRFLMVSYPNTQSLAGPPSPESMAEIERFVEAERKSGVLIEGADCRLRDRGSQFA